MVAAQAVTLLKVAASGQVYQIDLPEIKITPDRDGGYYLHGRGHFMFFAGHEEAAKKKTELDLFGPR